MENEKEIGIQGKLEAISQKHKRQESGVSISISKNSSNSSSDDNIPLGHSRAASNTNNNNLGRLTVDSRTRSLSNLSDVPPTLVNLKEQDKNCECRKVINKSDPRKCQICQGHFASIVKAFQDRNYYTKELEQARSQLELARKAQDKSMEEVGRLRAKIASLEDDIDSKNDEISKLKKEMEIMGEKLLEEIAARKELQTSKDAVQDELEELTKSLFEEANTLVANEARERHGAQLLQQQTAKQLAETKLHLQTEQAELRQLRVRINQLETQQEQWLQERAKQKPSILPVEVPSGEEATVSLDQLIDPQLFSHFKELFEEGPNMKATKFRDLIFMRNALEDDVTPCLRFGGNPRTSTKKFIDAIVLNHCFIEEMTPEQIKELEDRDEKNKLASQQSLEKEPPTPSASLFNKTMLERLSNALSTTPVLPNTGGCSTCGREEKYQYRFKITDVQEDSWYPICLNCKDRLLAVCDFYRLIRNVRQGVYSTKTAEQVYFEALNIKRKMFFTRIGLGNIQNADLILTKLEPISPNQNLLSDYNNLVSPGANTNFK
ncbi:rab guanine nucleotide exchange factor S2 [Boothiomyces macroporosus]|uniref:Rab guanine nucleotide exchange factor S2 n=1 Tax=Boothiomyces macroporosus TaxID=261099 RepID=A0AAD5Y5S5_9FUNG|nr:rab guanine nucleotide exchange factor S2 [Boothiomyces macroporosus]